MSDEHSVTQLDPNTVAAATKTADWAARDASSLLARADSHVDGKPHEATMAGVWASMAATQASLAVAAELRALRLSLAKR